MLAGRGSSEGGEGGEAASRVGCGPSGEESFELGELAISPSVLGSEGGVPTRWPTAEACGAGEPPSVGHGVPARGTDGGHAGGSAKEKGGAGVRGAAGVVSLGDGVEKGVESSETICWIMLFAILAQQLPPFSLSLPPLPPPLLDVFVAPLRSGVGAEGRRAAGGESDMLVAIARAEAGDPTIERERQEFGVDTCEARSE